MKLCPGCASPLGEAQRCSACGHTTGTEDGFEILAPDIAAVRTGYDPAFYTQLAALEGGNFWFQARNRLIVHAIRKYFPQCRSLLEIGCGTGQVLAAMAGALPEAQMTGSELFVEGLAVARRRVPAAHFLQMDATRIPYRDEFDVIGAFDVIEHIADDRRVLSEIHRALKPGGGVILTVPQHPWLWSHQDELAHHQRRYRRSELQDKLTACGFSLLYSTSFITLLLPLLMVSRLARRRHDDDPFREMHLGRLSNTVLDGILKLEYLMLRGGLRLPAGGTLLAVAAKAPLARVEG